jgi:hypothetical protein
MKRDRSRSVLSRGLLAHKKLIGRDLIYAIKTWSETARSELARDARAHHYAVMLE